MRKNRIPLATPTMHGEELEFVHEAFETNWIAPVGPHVDLLENEFKNYLGIEGVCAVSSGTAALHLVYKLANISEGDIVLVQDLTFSATVNPIIYQGARPVFIDSERDTWNMDPRALEKAIKIYKDKVKAVVVVHLYGTPAKLDEIIELCNLNGILLIEDAAESLSSTYKGIFTGTFGEFSAISFNGNKIITTSGGGMVLTHNKKFSDKAKFWSTQSKDKANWYQHSEIGYNYRISNVCAAIGRGQLIHIDEHRLEKTKIFNRYKDKFNSLSLVMNQHERHSAPNFWLSCILIDRVAIEKGVTPERIISELNSKNIESRHLWKPMHMQPVFEKYDYIKVEEESVSEDLFYRGLCLPSDIKMSERDQDIVIANIKEIFEK